MVKGQKQMYLESRGEVRNWERKQKTQSQHGKYRSTKCVESGREIDESEEDREQKNQSVYEHNVKR